MCHFLDYSVKLNRIVVNIFFYELPRPRSPQSLHSLIATSSILSFLSKVSVDLFEAEDKWLHTFTSPLLILCFYSTGSAVAFLQLPLFYVCICSFCVFVHVRVSSPNWEFVFIKSREWTLRCKSTPVVYVSSVSVGGGSRLTVANHPLSSIINNHNHIMNLQLSPKLRAPGRDPSLSSSLEIMSRFFFNVLACFPP